MFGNVVLGLVYQEIFGVFYDVNIKEINQCYGLYCFIWSFVIIVVFSFCVFILNIGLLQKKIDEKKYDGEFFKVELCCLQIFYLKFKNNCLLGYMMLYLCMVIDLRFIYFF